MNRFSPFRDKAWARVPRALLAGCFFLAFGVGSVLISFLVLPGVLLFGGSARGRRAVRASVRATYRLFVWAARVTGLFRVTLSAADRARLAGLRGCVVAMNHPSLIDVVVLIAHLGDATAVAKSAAARNPFYARIVKSAFLVNDNPMGVLEEARAFLAAGGNVIVFPEGTRTPLDGPAGRLRRGAAQIALHAGAPVVPVRLALEPRVLAKGQPWYDVGARTIEYALSVGENIPVPRGLSRPAALALTGKIGAICGIGPRICGIGPRNVV